MIFLPFMIPNAHFVIGFLVYILGYAAGYYFKSKTSASENTNEYYDDDPNTKMVILVRNDLNMGKGKIAAQVGHACVGAVETARYQEPRLLWQWSRALHKKICLRVSSLQELKEIYTKAQNAGIIVELVQDAGYTQVSPNTYTVCAIGPGYDKDIDAITGHLKLL